MAADIVIDGIVACMQSLATFPARCRLAPENDGVSYELRQITCGDRQSGYRILFQILKEPEKVVLIKSVRHTARREMRSRELEN